MAVTKNWVLNNSYSRIKKGIFEWKNFFLKKASCLYSNFKRFSFLFEMVQSFSTLVDNWLMYDSGDDWPISFTAGSRMNIRMPTDKRHWLSPDQVIYQSIINQCWKTLHHFEEKWEPFKMTIKTTSFLIFLFEYTSFIRIKALFKIRFFVSAEYQKIFKKPVVFIVILKVSHFSSKWC